MTRLFGRVTTSGRQIREVDGLRFIAIGFVFLQHTQQTVVHNAIAAGTHMDLVARCLDLARFGVEVFFAISGFILGLPFAEAALRGAAPVRLKSYFLRRLTRLEPPYLLALAVSFVMGIWCFGQNGREMVPHLVASAGYAHNIVYGPIHNPFNPVTWSLEIEVQFYCLMPLIALVYWIPSRWLRRGVFVAIYVADAWVCKWLFSHGYDVPESVVGFLNFFLIGLVVADLYTTDWCENPGKHWCFDVVGLIGWPLLFAAGWLHLRANVPPLIVAAVFYSAFRGPLTLRFLRWTPVMLIGGMCYSIYLLHVPLQSLIGPWAAGLSLGGPLIFDTILHSVVVGVPVLCICALFFLLIEKPCMRRDWPQRLWASLRAQTDSAVKIPNRSEGSERTVP
jgi:peptidoglycan/LPS O-acetylase OafA/YrhL